MLLRIIKWFFLGIAVLALLGALVFFWTDKDVPERISYGVSFNTLYARELGLDWQMTYDAILDELGVRHLRLAAHWNMVEGERGTYNWSELDYQLGKTKMRGATVIFGVGRRLPRWPECHAPEWAKALPWEEQKKELRKYISEVIMRYKDNPAITYWQVENEPFLGVFAPEHCGVLDEAFLDEEIALVRELDPTRPILITDSGNLGTWWQAYKRGDAFGTSVYVHFWNPELGQFRTLLPPWFYRFKEGVLSLLYGEKKTFLIELSLEPWLLEPIVNVPKDVQYSRMNLAKFDEIIEYAGGTRYDTQYLWGAEWWYWLREHGEPAMWERARRLYQDAGK